MAIKIFSNPFLRNFLTHLNSRQLKTKVEDIIAKLKVFSTDTIPYSYDNKEVLPKLPLPTMDETLKLYLTNLKVLLDDASLIRATSLVQNFAETIGPQAQRYLEKRAEKKENWVLEYFNQEYYLDIRTSLPVYLNPSVALPPRKFSGLVDMAKYGAVVIDTCMEQKELIDSQSIPIEKTKHPLCMSQWYNCLTTCRVPAPNRDYAVTTLGSKPDEEHVIVIHKNQFYKVLVKSKERLAIPNIAYELLKILEQPHRDHKMVPAIGVLTAWDRDQWAEAYAILKQDPSNQNNLEAIQTSLAVLCLDEPLPDTFNLTKASNDLPDKHLRFHTGKRDEVNMFHQMLHGGGSAHNSSNRWFDKTVQFFISPDGVSGASMEHVTFDGICLLDLVDKVWDKANELNPNMEIKEANTPSLTSKLDWKVNEHIQKCIADASNHIDGIVPQCDIHTYRHLNLGRNGIKALKCSPDVFIQLAIQLAYFKFHGRMISVWESVAVRKFRLGRVTVSRSATIDTLNWLNSMQKDNKDEERLKLLEKAINTLYNQLVACADGKDLDLHLLGLREASLALSGRLHPMFLDESYQIANTFTVGTSQVPSRIETIIGYGHPALDGYGCCYDIRPDFTRFCVTSWKSNEKTSSMGFVRALKESMDDMAKLLKMKK